MTYYSDDCLRYLIVYGKFKTLRGKTKTPENSFPPYLQLLKQLSWTCKLTFLITERQKNFVLFELNKQLSGIKFISVIWKTRTKFYFVRLVDQKKTKNIKRTSIYFSKTAQK